MTFWCGDNLLISNQQTVLKNEEQGKKCRAGAQACVEGVQAAVSLEQVGGTRSYLGQEHHVDAWPQGQAVHGVRHHGAIYASERWKVNSWSKKFTIEPQSGFETGRRMNQQTWRQIRNYAIWRREKKDLEKCGIPLSSSTHICGPKEERERRRKIFKQIMAKTVANLRKIWIYTSSSVKFK